MINLMGTKSASFCERLYESLLISRICLQMCETPRVSAGKIRKIDQYAIRV